MKRLAGVLFLLMLGAGVYLAVAPDVIDVGEVRVTQETPERLAIARPPTAAIHEDDSMVNVPPGSAHALLSGAEIPFVNPEVARNWIDPAATYLVTELPFSLALEEAELLEDPTARYFLEITDATTTRQLEVTTGRSITIGDASFTVSDLRRWAGALADPEGVPYVILGIQGADDLWTPPLILSKTAEARIDETLLVQMDWHSSESDAHAAIEAGPQTPERPRWGIVDGPGVQWFDGFLPGTGAIRQDGIAVTLIGIEEGEDGRDVWVFEIVDGEETHIETVEPTVSEDHPMLQFDGIAGTSDLLWIHGWRDRIVLAALSADDELIDTETLALGDSWQLPGLDVTIRLEGATQSGALVRSEDSPFYQAVLEDEEGGWLFLREGETERVNDLHVRFIREQNPPEMAYHLYVDQNGSRSAFSLESEASFRVGPWAFHPGTPDPRAPEIAITHVEYHRRDWLGRAGIILATIGFVGLVVTALTRLSGAS